MKIIQVSDLHLVPSGQMLYGLNPLARLKSCIDAINAEQSDAEFCIFTGDLSNAGRLESYRDLRACLKDMRLPIHLAIGNHDKRSNFSAVFPDTLTDENGFIQYSLDFPDTRILVLDTVEEGEHWGSYCEPRAQWLDRELSRASDKSVYIFMHHPPFEIGLPCMDHIRIRQPDLFGEVISRYSNIRHIFHGHVHRPVCGNWRGISVSALRGTNHQVQFDLQTVEPVPLCHEQPSYAMILLKPEQTIVHFHDFLDNNAITESQASNYRSDHTIAELTSAAN